MSCSHFKSCPLFAQFALHPALSIWQENYCEQDHTQCARFERSSSGAAVPVTLLPNGKVLSAKQSEQEMHGVVLFNAVTKNRAWMLKNLLEKVGADVNFQNIEGTTALMVAAEQGYVEMVRLLMNAGADATLANIANETASDIAKRTGNHTIATLIDSLKNKGKVVDLEQKRKSA